MMETPKKSWIGRLLKASQSRQLFADLQAIVEPSISSEVARGSGDSSAVMETLSPRPTTIAGAGLATSARIPPSLRSPT